MSSLTHQVPHDGLEIVVALHLHPPTFEGPLMLMMVVLVVVTPRRIARQPRAGRILRKHGYPDRQCHFDSLASKTYPSVRCKCKNKILLTLRQFHQLNIVQIKYKIQCSLLAIYGYLSRGCRRRGQRAGVHLEGTSRSSSCWALIHSPFGLCQQRSKLQGLSSKNLLFFLMQ